MFRSFIIGTLTLALCACSSQAGSQVPLTQTPELIAAAPTATPRDENSRDDFRCSTEKLYRGDKLTITMPVPHAGELAVVSPDGGFFYYAFEQQDGRLPAQPVIHAREFKNMKTLQLSTDEAKALAYRKDREEPETELVFDEPGKYQVFMGDPLDVDLEDINPEGFCTVEYFTEPRPR